MMLPARIREARLLRGMSQDTLARMTKTSQDYVSMWELGQQGVHPDRVPRLLKALDVTLEMLEGTEPLPEERTDVGRRKWAMDPVLEAERRESRDRMAKRDRGELPELGTPIRIPSDLELR